MATAAQIAWDDMILPFQLDRADIRGRVARLDGVLDTILDQHAYPAPVADLVAEACLLTALIGQTMKLRWRLSLQVRGEGPIRLIATDYFAPAAEGEPALVRAYASFDADQLPERTPDAFPLLGQGVFGMLIDQGRGTTPYQGLTPLSGASLGACAETYFAQSEQIATRFLLSVAQAGVPGSGLHWRAGGVMLQHMPKASPHVRDLPSGEDGLLAAADIVSGEEGENWARVNYLLDTAETHELVGPLVSPDQLLVRLFHEEVPRVFDAQAVRFGCTCSAEKVVGAMAQYSARDIGHMTTEEGNLTADCQFCGAHYEFDPRKLGFEADR
ncbi:Hsp33 family molecular chaperone HslO [Paroceanicella profunda]|uniref:Hsp33 family molecular chaperone HslO n=1 Tax=Paroceanicella profunda TaxID=2579971 RepID=A0A5B8G3T3_9RHOB|nr:Hsp33 family molecular chaperone HslO [Paroceanicella profunda]QDL93473.1 Hsp33 family molecular chaperone HslO [Paroceanicella profunda]